MFRTASFLILILMVIPLSCRKTLPGDEPVARWGDSVITQDHFIREYQLFGTYAPLTDSLGSRTYYASVMLERQIIADYGLSHHLDTLPQVKNMIKRRAENAARRHLFNMMVKPDVPDPEWSEIEEAFVRANTRVNTQQIYAQTKSEIDSLYHLLRQGADFDQLAYQAMVKAGYEEGGNLGHMGWVTFDQLDEAPEKVLFSLDRHTISVPVQSLRGWHIFRVHDIEKTIHFDRSALENIRESLRHAIYQRRFAESTAAFTRSLLEQHELATDMVVLQAVYNQLKPSLPLGAHPREWIRFNQELALFEPGIPPQTPLAYIDGNPFTVAQFLYHLPDIPYNWLGNFHEAVQIAVRDSILAAFAYQTVRPDTAREYQLDKQVAAYSALYYATLNRVADTLDLDRLTPVYYDKWKAQQFTEQVQVEFVSYHIADSALAWRVLLDFQQSKNWKRALESLPVGSYVEKKGMVNTTDHPKHPAHRLKPDPSDERHSVAGPYREDTWVIYKALNQSVILKPYDQVAGELRSLIHERKIQIAHNESLPSLYNPDDIWLDEVRLNEVLPYY